MTKRQTLARVAISVFALVLLAAQLTERLNMDLTALGLAALVVLPWVSTVIESATLPGGWQLKFREVEREQLRQRSQIDTLRFLVNYFVTDWELEHLRKLATGEPFPFKPNESFKNELRRLRDVGLIEEKSNASIDQLFYVGSDAREFVGITQRGRDYLELRAAADAG